MDCFYDRNLKYKLPATNDASEIVLNGTFRKWTGHIARNLCNRIPAGGERYDDGPDRILLGLCRNHARYYKTESYQAEKCSGITVMLTHPFYLHLSHMDKVRSESVQIEVDDYLDNLMRFLNLKRDRSKVRVVALETIHHYAAATSLLLERGLLDQIIFTTYDLGRPLDESELYWCGRDDIFFAGGYNKSCLSSSIQVMKAKKTDGKILAIKELVLNSPLDHEDTLRTAKVDGLSRSRMISLEEAVRKLGIKQ